VTNKSKDYEGNPWGWNGAVISCRFRTTPDSKFGKINPTKLGQFRRVRGWLEVASDIDGYARMKRDRCGEARRAQSSIPWPATCTCTRPPRSPHTHCHLIHPPRRTRPPSRPSISSRNASTSWYAARSERGRRRYRTPIELRVGVLPGDGPMDLVPELRQI
jgi:hypothetical protein